MAYLGNSPLNALYSFTPITLAQDQTQVLVNYTPGRCLFFKNGALLEPNTDYTAANGSTVTLASPASAGDVLTGINLASFAVANALPLNGGVLTGPVSGPASAAEGTAGLIALATTALAQGLTNDTAALTAKKLDDAFKGANQSLALSGYQKYPGGLIEQWGFYTGPDAAVTGTVTFPIAFPNECFNVLITDVATNTASVSALAGGGTLTATSFPWYANTDQGFRFRWRALGR